MAAPLIQSQVNAGELSPSLYGRVDLAKYREGCSTLRNMWASYKGGASSRADITIDVRAVDGSVLVGVADNGPGVPETERSRIFDPFYSTKREMAGVGLGLFVAEGLVRSAGGRLSVRAASTGGALFEIELRMADGPDRKSAEAARGVAVSS